MGFFFSVRGFFLAGAIVLALDAQAARQPAATPNDAVLAMFGQPFRDTLERGLANGAWQGLALGLIEGQQRAIGYFGHCDDPRSGPPNADSAFEIGAVSEIFTGLLLAQAAVEGRLRFGDAVARFLPAGFPFADAHGGAITLEQLATQRSGLPPQPANLFPATLEDPYAGYAAEDLLALLAQQPLDAGEEAGAYSVLNAGLLGHLLGRSYQMPYTQLVHDKLLVPLGMSHSGFGDEGLLNGHARSIPAAHWHYGVLAATAGLRSTLPDLLAFLQQNLTPGASPLRKALLLARQPRATDRADAPALGWNVREIQDGERRWPLLWRASRTGGFASFVGFRTDKQKAIALLGNSTQDVAALGLAWLAETLPPAPPRAFSPPTGADLAAYAGLYRIAAGNDLIVRADTGALSVQLPGGLPLRLHALGPDTFVGDDGSTAVTFERFADDISGVMLSLGGNHASASRLSGRAPRLSRTPIPADVTGLPGDYRLDASTWLRIGQSDGILILQPTLAARRAIFAYAPDRYGDGDGAIDFTVERDRQGRIAHLLFNMAGVERRATPLSSHPNAAVK